MQIACRTQLVQHIIVIKSDWGTLVPRISVENLMKLGFVLE
jgi:hypothetical protein